MSRAQSNFDQVFRRGLNIDAGVGHEEDLALARDHHIATGDAVQSFTHADDLQRRTDRVGEMLGNAGDQRIGIAHTHHHGAEHVAIVDQRMSFMQRDAAALAQVEKLESICLAMLGGSRIDDLHALKIHPQFLCPRLNCRGITQKDRLADFLFDQRMAGTQDFFVVAFGEHNLPRIGLGFVNHRARHFVGLAQPAFQVRAVSIEIDRLLRHSAAHRRFCDC